MRLGTLAVALTLFAGCAEWTVIEQATPSPLTAQTQLAIDGTSFTGLIVDHKPEADYLAARPTEAQAFQNDKLAFLAGFTAGVTAARGALDIDGPEALAGRYVIRSRVESMVPGIYDRLFRTPTEMRVRVGVAAPNGSVVDEIELQCTVPADAYRPALGMRIAECGRIVGARVAHYLRQRAGAS
jgi:hypothetical protein